MKTNIKSSALIIALALLSTGAFAATKSNEGPEAPQQDQVIFTAVSQDQEVGVIIHQAEASKAAVTIYDAEGNVMLKDVLSKKDVVAKKGYDLSQLEEGDYTIKVTSNHVETKRLVHVYSDENDQKAFFFII